MLAISTNRVFAVLLAGLLSLAACEVNIDSNGADTDTNEVCAEFGAVFEEIESFAANPRLDDPEAIVAMRESMQAFVDTDPSAAVTVAARDILDALGVLLDGAESGAEPGSTFELRAAESKLQASAIFLDGYC